MNLEKSKLAVSKLFGSSNYVRGIILICVTIIFTVLLYPNLVIKKHSYKLGDVAETDIKATKDFLIEHKEATEASRRRAEENVLTVYDYDVTLSDKVNQRVKTAFDDLRAVLEAEKNQSKDAPKQSEAASTDNVEKKPSVHDLLWQKKADFEEKIGISVSDGAYKILEKEAFSHDIENLITRISTEILENGVVTNKELLLRATDKGIILKDIRTKTEQVVHQLKHYYGLGQAKTMVKIIGQPLLKGLNYNLRNMIVDFVQRLIQPNITLNKSETEERKKIAALEVEPVLYKIKAGEMLLREGERVTKIQLLKLKASQAGIKNKQILASCVGSAMIILCIFMTTYILYINHLKNSLIYSNRLYLICVFFRSLIQN